MISTILVLCLSFITSFAICFLEIVYGKYKLNHTLVLKKPRYLIYYCILYSIIAAIITFLVIHNDINIKNFKFAEFPFMTALSFGIATKSIAKISFYSFKIETKTISVGPKIVTDYLDDFFLKKLNDDVDKQLISKIHIVEKVLVKNRSLVQMDTAICKILPTDLPKIKKTSYQKEIASYKNGFDKCRYFATSFGMNRLIMLEESLQ